MARRRDERTDYFERALGRGERHRRSRELGDPMPAPPGLNDPLPVHRMRRTLLLLGAALAVLVLSRAAAQSRSPRLPASCTTLALRLSPSSVHTGAVLRWSATGPAGTPITVALDGKPVSRPGASLAKCAASGGFVTGANPGRRTVTLVDGRSGSVIASVPVTVTAR